MTKNIIDINADYTDEDVREAVNLANGPERLHTYNALTGKDTRKFANRNAALKQTFRALIEHRDALRRERQERNRAAMEAKQERCEGLEKTEADMADPTLPERPPPKPPKPREPIYDAENPRSIGQHVAWQDPETHAKRSQRHGVLVDGVYYQSVRAAYVDLGLPIKEHIQFRGQLKELGEADNHGRHWKMVPRRAMRNNQEQQS